MVSQAPGRCSSARWGPGAGAASLTSHLCSRSVSDCWLSVEKVRGSIDGWRLLIVVCPSLLLLPLWCRCPPGGRCRLVSEPICEERSCMELGAHNVNIGTWLSLFLSRAHSSFWITSTLGWDFTISKYHSTNILVIYVLLFSPNQKNMLIFYECNQIFILTSSLYEILSIYLQSVAQKIAPQTHSDFQILMQTLSLGLLESGACWVSLPSPLLPLFLFAVNRTFYCIYLI